MMEKERKDELYIGIDLGGTTVKGALVDDSGAIHFENCLEADQHSREKLLNQIIDTVDALRNHEDSAGRVRAIGIGVPGLVNSTTNRIEVLPNLPGITELDVAGDVSNKTGLPVIIDNDANAAAYGELKAGAAQGKRHVFYVTLGAGVGSGLIINGEVYRGADGFAGEFGHMTIDPEGIECGCGNIGCLETIVSGPNIVRRTRERLYRDRTSSLSSLSVPRDRELMAEDIARAARNGDEMAQVMMERTGMFIGIALAAVVNLLNVQMIVLGGGVMDAGDLVLKPTIHEIRRRAFPPSFKSCEIVIAKLGQSAGMIGSAMLARDQVR